MYQKLTNVINELKQLHKLHIQLMIKHCQGLTPEQGKLLFFIRQHKMSQRELAKVFSITEATLSVRIKRLLEAGLIEKTNDQADKRVCTIGLSQKGDKLLNEMEEYIEHYQKVICRDMTCEEYETVIAIIHKIEKNLKEELEC
jgi:Transcriptional regulators